MKKQPVGLCYWQKKKREKTPQFCSDVWILTSLTSSPAECVFKFISWGHLLCKAGEEGREKWLFSEFISQTKKRKIKISPHWGLIRVCHSGLNILSTTRRSFLLNPPCRPTSWWKQDFDSSVLVGLLFGVAEEGEEAGDGFQGYAFARLLCRIFAGLPLVEDLLVDHILVVKTVEEHQQEAWRNRAQRSASTLARKTVSAFSPDCCRWIEKQTLQVTATFFFLTFIVRDKNGENMLIFLRNVELKRSK